MPRVKPPVTPPARTRTLHEVHQASRAWSTATVVMHAALAARLGLHATDHKAVDVLLQGGPMTAGELADRMGLTGSAITTMVDRLERHGLVRRDRDARDRRRVIVRPTVTPDFERRFMTLMGPMLADYGRYLAGLSTEELNLVKRFLTETVALSEAHIRRLRGDAP
jgi:DNA-binding MarR family transcriptional regulator